MSSTKSVPEHSQPPTRGKWRHPVHSRGVQSPRVPTPLTDLTDARIEHYIRLGYYGEERRRTLAENERKPKRQSPASRAAARVSRQAKRHTTLAQEAAIDDILSDII